MERQLQPNNVATNDVGTEFIWYLEIYPKLNSNFKYAMNGVNTDAQFMSCGLNGQAK